MTQSIRVALVEPPERVRWYPKVDSIFSDALALVRREL